MSTKQTRQKTRSYYSMLCGINRFLMCLCIISNLSCQTAPEKIEKLLSEKQEPEVCSKNVEWIYTKKGIIQYRVISPEVYRFENKKEYIEFPSGVEVYSFDTKGRQQSYMKSDYARQNQGDKTIEAKGSVVLENKKGEKLETEHLIFDKRAEQISTNGVVKITQRGQAVFGQGFKSNTSFTNYTLKKSRGIINIDTVNKQRTNSVDQN